MKYPTYDQGILEAAARNNKLNLSFVYVGNNNHISLMDDAVRRGIGRLFYAFPTDAKGPLLQSVWTTRVRELIFPPHQEKMATERESRHEKSTQEEKRKTPHRKHSPLSSTY